MEETNIQVPPPIPTPVPPIPPTPEPPIINPIETKKPPILTIVLVVILVLSLAAIGFFVYQNMQLQKQITETQSTNQAQISYVSPTPIATPDPTTNWETYTNTNLGFSFQHPSSFTKTDEHLTETDLNNNSGNLIFSNTTNDNIVLALNKDDGSTIDELATRQSGIHQRTQVAGIDAIRTITTFPNEGTEEISVYFKHNGYIYFYQAFDESPINNIVTISDQILSTFKFTN